LTARLYLDEDTLPELAALLRDRGYDVLSAHDIGALGITDEEQLAIAISERRAIVSSNRRDFARLATHCSENGIEHWGIVLMYRQYRRRELGAGIRDFEQFLSAFGEDDLRNTTLPLSIGDRTPE
jgi:uncharacterized protein with PIN domain